MYPERAVATVRRRQISNDDCAAWRSMKLAVGEESRSLPPRVEYHIILEDVCVASRLIYRLVVSTWARLIRDQI